MALKITNSFTYLILSVLPEDTTQENEIMKKPNFIVTRLSDMDFIDIQKESLKAIGIKAFAGTNWNEETFKKALIRHMLGLSICHQSCKGELGSFKDYQYLLSYFDEQMVVSFSNKKPIMDFGDNIYFDVNASECFHY